MTAQHGRAALLTRVLSVWPSAATAACSSPTAQSSSDRESPKVPRAETLRWAGPANWPGVVQYYSELGLWRHLGVVRVVEGEVEEVVLVVTSCSLNSKSLNCCYEVVCTHLYELDALLDVQLGEAGQEDGLAEDGLVPVQRAAHRVRSAGVWG